MAIPSRGIGWGTEDNLLWQISKQLERLTCVTAGGCGSITTTTTSSTTAAPVYQVYTALLTQSGGDEFQYISSGELIIGRTYTIQEDSAGGYDFTVVGAPNNDWLTTFIATGTTPNWGDGNPELATLSFNTGAPVATVLENTIGNVWFTYLEPGAYGCSVEGSQLSNLVVFGQPVSFIFLYKFGGADVIIVNAEGDGNTNNYNIEIRVYN